MEVELIIKETPVPFIGETGIGIQKKLTGTPENIGSRAGNSTFTIDVPASGDGVKELFNNLFDINVNQADYSDFTPPRINTRLKAEAVVYQDKILVFKGYCRLREVVLSNAGQIVFKVVLYSELPDLFATIGEKYLRELDLSRFDHQYTEEYIVKSWDTSVQENGVAVPFQLGNGYVYPMIEYGANNEPNQKPTNWYWLHFKPAFYVKTILDQIFSEAGFNYTSDFFESNKFLTLIMPYSNGLFAISEDDVSLREFEASRAGTVSLSNISGVLTLANAAIFNNEINDPSSQYNNVIGQYTNANTGTYEFETSITGRFKYTGAGFNAGAAGTGSNIFQGNIEIARVDITTGLTSTIGVFTFSASSAIAGAVATFPLSGGIITTNTFTNTWTMTLRTVKVRLNAGDGIYVVCRRNPLSFGIPNADLQMELGIGSYFLNQPDAAISHGGTIPMSGTLPPDMKQKDFLAGIIKMFNLYFDDDETRFNTLIIEPRPDFYSGQDTIDLTTFFDIKQDCTIQHQGLAKYRSYLHTYLEDSDYYNADYTKRTGEIYGQLRTGIANEFLGDEYKIELPFAATPTIRQGNTNRAIPAIYFADDRGGVVDKAAKPRILSYGGLKDTASWTMWGITVGNPYTQYPYAGHLSDPYNPGFDLLFFPPKLLYWGGAGSLTVTLTNQTLFGNYYYQHIQEIDSEEAATASALFNIMTALFYKMGLRKQYFFNNCYWRLLEIVDYSVWPPKLTQVLFLKALDIQPPQPVEKVINGGTGPWVPFPDEGEHPASELVTPNPPGTRGNFGVNNLIPDSARNVLVVGNNVVMGEDVDGVTVLGGLNPVIGSGVEGGQYIGIDFSDAYFLGEYPSTSGLTAISGETVYIGGDIHVEGALKIHHNYQEAVITLTVANSSGYVAGAHSFVIFDTTDGDINIDMQAASEGTILITFVKRTGDANSVTITSLGGEIHTSSGPVPDITLSSQGESKYVVSDLTDWQELV